MTSHTPGPWLCDFTGVIRSTNKNGYAEPIRMAGAWVAGAWDGDPEAIANATLMAAAPELREALEWALAEITGETSYTAPDQRENCLQKAEAAILKATQSAASSTCGISDPSSEMKPIPSATQERIAELEAGLEQIAASCPPLRKKTYPNTYKGGYDAASQWSADIAQALLKIEHREER